MDIRAIATGLKRSLLVCCAILLVCASFLASAAAPAFAGESAANVVQNRAERALDNAAGAGTADQIKGSVNSNVGKAQRGFDQTAEGMGNQVKGKVQSDIGRAKSTAEDAADQVEDTSEGIMSSVKNFFD